MKPLRFLLALAVAGPTLVSAQAHVHTPVDAVQAFHEALASGDKQAVLAYLDPEVLVFESGGAELSRDEYSSHHLGADMEFSAATTRTVVDQRHEELGETAWVLTRSETAGTFRSREVDARGVETVLLRQTEDGWRIVHIHWSSRSR